MLKRLRFWILRVLRLYYKSMGEGTKKVGILYWGSRGGGKLLTEQLIGQARDQGVPTAIFLRPIKAQAASDYVSSLSFLMWIRERRRVMLECVNLNIQVMIIPMASPWDIFLGKKLQKSGITVIRLIHDATPHPGDRFPPRFWIKALCFDSNKIVALSEYVARQLTLRNYAPQEKIVTGKLPGVTTTQINEPMRTLPRQNFLFLGRGRKHKGLELLLAAWPSVGDSESRLTVAGEGHSLTLKESRMSHIDRWLSDSEIINLILASDVVVLPYIEASQSGIIPLATSLNRPVVITPVGGLAEQVRDRLTGIISLSLEVDDLSEAMNRARVENFDFDIDVFGGKATQTLLEICLDPS